MLKISQMMRNKTVYQTVSSFGVLNKDHHAQDSQVRDA